MTSRDRISKEAGWRDSSKLPRGPNGRALCRRCQAEVPKGRRAWCGDACIQDHRIESDPGYARARVEERDGGVCVLCGLDVGAWLRAYRAELRILSAAPYDWVGVHDLDGRLSLVLGRRHGWEMDHIKPVVEGRGVRDRQPAHPVHPVPQARDQAAGRTPGRCAQNTTELGPRR